MNNNWWLTSGFPGLPGRSIPTSKNFTDPLGSCTCRHFRRAAYSFPICAVAWSAQALPLERYSISYRNVSNIDWLPLCCSNWNLLVTFLRFERKLWCCMVWGNTTRFGFRLGYACTPRSPTVAFTSVSIVLSLVSKSGSRKSSCNTKINDTQFLLVLDGKIMEKPAQDCNHIYIVQLLSASSSPFILDLNCSSRSSSGGGSSWMSCNGRSESTPRNGNKWNHNK